LKIDIPSSDSSKDKDENDNRHNFSKSNSQDAFADSHYMISQLHPFDWDNFQNTNTNSSREERKDRML